jgi:hypothetical protein
MAKKVTYFKIRTSNETIHKQTDRKVGEYVWLNKKTNGMELRKPGVKRIADFKRYKVYLIPNPGEKALNSDWVI